jgi:hypothetical protein
MRSSVTCSGSRPVTWRKKKVSKIGHACCAEVHRNEQCAWILRWLGRWWPYKQVLEGYLVGVLWGGVMHDHAGVGPEAVLAVWQRACEHYEEAQVVRTRGAHTGPGMPDASSSCSLLLAWGEALIGAMGVAASSSWSPGSQRKNRRRKGHTRGKREKGGKGRSARKERSPKLKEGVVAVLVICRAVWY